MMTSKTMGESANHREVKHFGRICIVMLYKLKKGPIQAISKITIYFPLES